MTATNGTHRDLVSEARAFLSKLGADISRMEKLHPYNTPELRAEALPYFFSIYDAIGHTTLDTALEKTILSLEETPAISERIRRSYNVCEAEFEIATAKRMVEAGSVEKARYVLHGGNLDVFYNRFLPFEWTALSTVLGRSPQSVAILGSGPLPESGIWIMDWAKRSGNPVFVHHVDIDPDRLALSQDVYKSLAIDESKISFEAGDVRSAPKDLSEFDVVYFLLMVGRTEEERESILYDVVCRLKPGAVILARTTISLKTIAYAPVPIQTPRLMKRMRPVLTSHGHGDTQGMVNASVVISKVL